MIHHFHGKSLASIACGMAMSFVAVTDDAWAQSLLMKDRELGTVRGWSIGINSDSKACIAQATYQDQTTVWFGFEPGHEGFFALSNPKWKAIEAGKGYTLQLYPHGKGRWTGSFVGGVFSGDKSLLSRELKADFMIDIARATGIDVRLDGKSITRLSLSGSMAALDSLLECHDSIGTLAARGEERPTPSRSRSKPDVEEEKGGSTGTGFFVSRAGHLLTNHHVIAECRNVEITRSGSVPEPVQVIARDATNDLALLKAREGADKVASFAPRVRMGDSIYVYGFPLSGLLASSGNFTIGNVTASTGLNDDSRMLQISAPVQPGNSGGPLMDSNGNIAGVIVSKLNVLRLAAATNDVAQNVNFAIKSSVAQTFLDGHSVDIEYGSSAPQSLAPADIAEKAKEFTVFVRCD